MVNRGAAVGEFLLMSITSMPLWLMIAIPISGFISVNWVFSRILADRELVVMQSIGLSPFQLAKAPIAFGIILTRFLHSIPVIYCRHPSVFTRICSLNCVIAFQQFSLRENVFIEVVDGMTMFIGARDNNDAMKDIFIHDARIDDRIITMTAESGEFIDHNGSPKLILQNGERSERNKGGQSGAILLFDTHSVTISRINNQPTERATTDINEDSIRNLLSPKPPPQQDFFAKTCRRALPDRVAMAWAWFSIALDCNNFAGQIRRDLWGIRASTNILACVL